ncbi:MAG TPA: hypothetical protein VGS78_05800 [Candidatus Sulfotelmatobacter sp.]|nr:hypothetical protein [Candidatus Sulfotelmatobacter sp.]
MSRTNRNFVVAYIVLVGLPLLGLAGILRSGRHLTAPISVDGTWRIEVNGNAAAGPACAAASTFLSSPFVIGQSGRNLIVTFGKNKATATGTLDNKSLNTSIPAGDEVSAAQCGPAMLTAAVNPAAEPRSMSGQLSFPGCQTCAPVEFRAIRQPRSPSGGMH